MHSIFEASPTPVLSSAASTAEQPRGQWLASGGEDPSQFNWQEAWHPIAYVQDLEPSQLSTFTLLEQDLVIWWDRPAQTWRVFVDQCPHRLAPLSEGRITPDGLLECPYHGWTFSGSGQCCRIPQQVDGHPVEQSRRACVQSLPTAVAQGMLFVYPGQSERAASTPVPLVEPLEEAPDEWIVLDGVRDLPFDVLTLLENVLDPSHLPFAHHRSVGDRSIAGPMDLDVTHSDRQGFQGIWETAVGPKKGQFGTQLTTFIAPNLMWHDLTTQEKNRTLTVAYCTPIRKGECRLFARFPFQFASPLPAILMNHTPSWAFHLLQNSILEDDQIFLHLQERHLVRRQDGRSFAQAFYMPTRADRFVVALHQWLQRYNADPFPDQQLPPELGREQVIERYHSHTVHCASCRTALRRIKRMRQGMVMGMFLAWMTAQFYLLGWGIESVELARIASIGVIGLSMIWLSLGWLERKFYEGRPIPLRNVSEK
ncbi:MAG: Rieske 2Fe-2S domain-containing protein [Acaryochloris sp. RU_4_1]|nr:Rieske 2Fe-2S domain-containing protein [Acaryochloris sp. RU_4_1]